MKKILAIISRGSSLCMKQQPNRVGFVCVVYLSKAFHCSETVFVKLFAMDKICCFFHRNHISFFSNRSPRGGTENAVKTNEKRTFYITTPSFPLF